MNDAAVLFPDHTFYRSAMIKFQKLNQLKQLSPFFPATNAFCLLGKDIGKGMITMFPAVSIPSHHHAPFRFCFCFVMGETASVPPAENS